MVSSYKNKKNLRKENFYSLLTLIFIFILFFSISFIIIAFINKQTLVNKFFAQYIVNNKNNITIQETYQILLQWSLPIYIVGISGILIFFIFILLGRQKIKYGYFFRTFWLIIFVGASIGVFFAPYDLWMQIILCLILIGITIVLLIELIKFESKKNLYRKEIRAEWRNKNIHQEDDFLKGGINNVK